MLGDFASLDVQNTYRGSDAYVIIINSDKIFYDILPIFSWMFFHL
ncbi:hypothetical protein [Piscirickettsia salmonis]